MIINVNARIAINKMAKNTALSGASIKKLAKGVRITKAGDDAAGLAISEKMRAQIRGMEQADRNVQNGISLVQTAEGCVEEIGNIAQRMRELGVQGANETNSKEDREKITAELSQLKGEIDDIAENAVFNGLPLFRGSKGFEAKDIQPATQMSGTNITNIKITEDLYEIDRIRFEATAKPNNTVDVKLIVITKDNKMDSQTVNIKKDVSNDIEKLDFDKYGISFNISNTSDTSRAFTNGEVKLKDNLGVGAKQIEIQAGPNGDTSSIFKIKISAMSTVALGISDSDINEISNQDKSKGTEAAKKFISKLDDVLYSINKNRSRLGSQQNGLEYISSNLKSSTENLTKAESRIIDLDIAKEMIKLSKLNILNQVSQSMVSQTSEQSNLLTQLLK